MASATEREEIRSERLDQRINASPETLKEMGREAGADFMLIGEINQIIDSEDGKKVSFRDSLTTPGRRARPERKQLPANEI